MSRPKTAGFSAGGARARHPLLHRLHIMEQNIARMGGPQNFRKDPAWLRLPAIKRELGLKRHRALLAYEKSSKQMQDVERAAAEADVSMRQFYTLLSEWTASGRSILSLVPFAHGRTPKSKLHPEVEQRLRTEILRAIDDGSRSPRAILASVRAAWPSSLKIPRETTIRSHIESAGGLDVVRSGPFTLNSSDAPQEEAETATRHGEVLVIDHIAPELFLDGNQPRRPTLTLAIDLFTATIAGFALKEGPPSPKAVLEVLADVERRTAANPGEVISSRLMISLTNGSEWRELASQLARRQLQTSIRWASRLHRGGPTKRLIGSRIGDVALLARKTHDPRGGRRSFDAKKHPLVTLAEARIVIEDAIRRSAEDRLVPGTVLNKLHLRKR